MTDVVVTVPKNFTDFRSPGKRGLAAWIGEGDPAGESWSGELWDFWIGYSFPDIRPGERVYVVCDGKLRGYAPLVRIAEQVERVAVRRPGDKSSRIRYALMRGGGAVAVTIPEPIVGFRGFRYRWWRREIEVPFPDWMCP